jgi:hypothetical protein
VYTSKLTDIRRIEKLAQHNGFEVERITLSMGSSANRSAFHDMQAQHSWATLPMVFAGEEFLGGETELERWLQQSTQATPEAWPGQGAVVWTLAGIAPFFMGLALSLSPAASWAQPLWLLYAGLILAFMCGTHWMDRVRQPQAGGVLLLTTLPVLALLPASLLPPAHYAGVIALALLSVLALDRQSLRDGRINRRYWQLRLIATGGATLSLLLGAWLLP